jgi:hypothetical protein
MGRHLATLTAAAALLVGGVAIPVINAMPSPVRLCSLRPPFDCISAVLTGAQFVEDDGPIQLAWLALSLVVAPALSLAGAVMFEGGWLRLGRVLAAAALVPNLALLIGIPQAVMPWQPTVVGLTLATLVGLAFPRHAKRPVSVRRRMTPPG